jgi:hypothetical protein
VDFHAANLTTARRNEASSEGGWVRIPAQKHWTSAAVPVDFANYL